MPPQQPLVVTSVDPELVRFDLFKSNDRSGIIGGQLTLAEAYVTFRGEETSYNSYPVVINLMKADVEIIKAAFDV